MLGSAPPRRGDLPGFTLVELVVVLAIITILAGITFPVYMRARRKAYITSCMSNLKQIYVAIELYRQDYDGLYPLALVPELHTHAAPRHTEVGVTCPGLYPSYLTSGEVLICPADTRRGAASSLAPNSYWYTVGEWMGYAFGPGRALLEVE